MSKIHTGDSMLDKDMLEFILSKLKKLPRRDPNEPKHPINDMFEGEYSLDNTIKVLEKKLADLTKEEYGGFEFREKSPPYITDPTLIDFDNNIDKIIKLY